MCGYVRFASKLYMHRKLCGAIERRALGQECIHNIEISVIAKYYSHIDNTNEMKTLFNHMLDDTCPKC